MMLNCKTDQVASKKSVRKLQQSSCYGVSAFGTSLNANKHVRNNIHRRKNTAHRHSTNNKLFHKMSDKPQCFVA